ncbi:MAG: leucine-rich repeat domain-containing protein, partial [Ureaplasma sp.]|nr:leucine-rich repeat domain-containing protein [Ureaplasma sp.]
SGYLNYRIFDLFKAVKTVENQSLGEFINGNPVHSLSSIQSLSTISVRIKSGLYKMTSKNLNNGDIKVENNNSISLNNLQLTSPESYFNWNGNAITGLTSIGRQQSVLAIPLRCTKINASAFAGLTSIRQVKISENVTSIESSAFKNCNYLNTVEFREGITNIGPYSFSGTVISTVAIPNSVTHIRDHAFYQCNSLTKYTINHSSSNLSLFDQYAFGECRNLSSVIIPSSCREIQPNAFAYSTQLRHVDMYSTQITMYNYAFTFDNYWGAINIYFYNLTNASSLSMTSLTFDYQNPTKLYFYVRNSTMVNALRPILSQHSPANFEVNTF